MDEESLGGAEKLAVILPADSPPSFSAFDFQLLCPFTFR
jgi:hypothetical protein